MQQTRLLAKTTGGFLLPTSFSGKFFFYLNNGDSSGVLFLAGCINDVGGNQSVRAERLHSTRWLNLFCAGTTFSHEACGNLL